MSAEQFLLVLIVAIAALLGGLTLAFVLRKRSTPEEKANQLRRERGLEDFDSEEGEDQAAPTPEPPARGTHVTLYEALKPTRRGLWERIASSLKEAESTGKKDLEELEEALYLSDLGPQTVQTIIENLKERFNGTQLALDPLKEAIREEMQRIFEQVNGTREVVLADTSTIPRVIMVVGVNGAGKTTTIGKLAGQLAAQGKKVMLAAGDTFRAAADAQLRVWTERAEVEIFSPPNIKDPAAVAFDALQKAKAKGFDVVLVDTAGRLHTQKNLMEELKKVKRVMSKVIPEAPHEVLLVLDASSGQNALQQAKEFHQALNVTGVTLTKMDGTAKGGIAVAVTNELQVPIVWVGVGESLQDLKPFSPQEYVQSII